MNEIKKRIAKINENKSQFFEKINKIGFNQTHQEKKGEDSNQ